MKFSIFNFQFSKVILLASFFLFAPFSFVDALQISPIRQTAVVELGTVQTIPLNVLNDEDERILLTPEVSGFRIDSTTGAALFDDEDIATDWIRVVPEKMLLMPGQRGTFSFVISVPLDVEVKSHYLGLFARKSSGGGDVSIGSRVGSLLFLHMSGQIEEGLVRKMFFVERKIQGKTPVVARITLENIGDIHVIPAGSVQVKSIFGGEVQTFVLNEGARKVLPGDVWNGEYIIDNLTWKDVGRITISADMKYGISGKEIHDSISFWYVPTWFLFILVDFILAGTFIFFYLRHKKKKV